MALLYNIRSLHNVGSIFRTADAAGIKKLYLCGITPVPVDRLGAVHPQLGKVSLGAERTVAWEKVGLAHSTSRLLVKLKEEGYEIFAVEQAEGSIPYHALTRQPKKCALILGNEVKGLPTSVLDRADVILEIPMHGRKESLNVGVAFGITAFHLRHLTAPDKNKKISGA